MEYITSVLTWLQTHWIEIVTAYTSLIGAASIIVQLTPTLADDNALKAVIKFIAKFIALNRPSEPTA